VIVEHDDRAEVNAQVGDDALLLVPADADLRLRLNGGEVAMSGLRGAIDGILNCGEVDIEWDLEHGDSRLQLNAGDVRIRFGARSDVLVTVKAPTSVVADPSFTKAGRGAWRLGEGRADLALDGNVGTIRLLAE
jgi:hypothetical protein